MNDLNEWWRGACIYQIYPRSFKDTNNTGIGDLKGVTEKLDYIASLGVDGIWITPFFTSPMKDFGYDVENFRDVDPMFGSIEDFHELLDNAHEKNLKVIIDLVFSHTSDQHPWFKEKPEYYVWADGCHVGNGVYGPPNNWVSLFGGSAWEWDEHRRKYYLHNFLKEQPDLNFHNPDVQKEVLDIVKFWLEFGVDGFRLDVVNFYFHDKLLRNNPPRDPELGAATQFEGEDPYSMQEHIYDKSQPENLDFIKKLRALMDQYDDRFTVGEIGDDHPFDRAAEYTEGHDYLNTCYNMHLLGGQKKHLTSDMIREPVETFSELKKGSWPSWAFSNHDVVRAASRWHWEGDGFSHEPKLSKMLIALLGCLRGTLFMYQGEELGLPEAKLKYEELKDPWGIHLWPEWQGRDGCRTPMPWLSAPNEESKGAWLPTPAQHYELSVETQDLDDNSILNFTRKFMSWRKTQKPLIKGNIKFINTGNGNILRFTRSYDGEPEIEALFNLSGEYQKFEELEPELEPYYFKITGFNL
tara:strand:- start:4376 stop:5947 length:1572 start_codon:yes stop_codon:yes gene_type:complete